MLRAAACLWLAEILACTDSTCTPLSRSLPAMLQGPSLSPGRAWNGQAYSHCATMQSSISAGITWLADAATNSPAQPLVLLRAASSAEPSSWPLMIQGLHAAQLHLEQS